MAWNIKEIKTQYSEVNLFTLTYSIEGVTVIKKHELSTDNGITYKEITPVGNTTGYSVNIELTSSETNCYIRCTDSEGNTQTSNPFIIQKTISSIKPIISNVKIQNVNQNGTYTLTYEVDTLNLSSHSLSIDNGEYEWIKPTLQDNLFTYVGSNLKSGTHLCSLIVTDYGLKKSDPVLFQIIIPEIPNNPPKINKVTVEETSSKGRFKISYTATDVDKKDLITHKIKIDNNDFVPMTPISINDKYTYIGLNLKEGSHNAIIQISDGKNIVESEPFTIIIESKDGEGIKEQLFIAKSEYDTSYINLIETITKVISDGTTIEGYDVSAGITLINEAYKVYTEKSVVLKNISQKAIDVIGSKKTNDSKENLEQEIGDLSNALGSLDQSMNDIFKDGILDDAEKLAIRQQLQALSLEKVDVDNQYNSILSKFNQTDLKFAEDGVIPPDFTGEKLESYPDKKWYLDLYNNFKKAYENYSAKYSNLILVIDYILKKETILDGNDKEKKDKAFDEYILAIGEYSKQASLAIDGIARNETENNEFVVKTFKAEYVRTNKENSAKLTELTQTTNGLNEKVSEFKQTADRIQMQVSENTNGLATQSSKITQLSNEINMMVNRNEHGSIVSLKPEEVVLGLNKYGKKGTWITLKDDYVTFENCYVSCKAITCLPDEDPIISLFGDVNSKYYGKCALDATARYNVGIGDAIRLKWDDSNYILVSENNFAVYTKGGGETARFRVNEEGVFYKNKNIGNTSTNMQGLEELLTVVVSSANSQYNSTIAPEPFRDGKITLGSVNHRWLAVYAKTGTIQTSDRNDKERISYLDTPQTMKIDISNDENIYSIKPHITKDDLYNFIKNDIHLATYNYKSEGDYPLDDINYQLGVIAQDIENTKVGQYVVCGDSTKDEPLGIIQTNYINTMMGALQVAINKIETLEEEIKNIKTEVI